MSGYEKFQKSISIYRICGLISTILLLIPFVLIFIINDIGLYTDVTKYILWGTLIIITFSYLSVILGAIKSHSKLMGFGVIFIGAMLGVIILKNMSIEPSISQFSTFKYLINSAVDNTMNSDSIIDFATSSFSNLSVIYEIVRFFIIIVSMKIIAFLLMTSFGNNVSEDKNNRKVGNAIKGKITRCYIGQILIIIGLFMIIIYQKALLYPLQDTINGVYGTTSIDINAFIEDFRIPFIITTIGIVLVFIGSSLTSSGLKGIKKLLGEIKTPIKKRSKMNSKDNNNIRTYTNPKKRR